MTRNAVLLSMMLSAGLAAQARAQELSDRPPVPTTVAPTPPAADDEIAFSAATLEYDNDADIVTAKGDVRMVREGNRLRADAVTWDRNTGRVVATGNIAVVNPGGDTAYGDSIELTDTLKDGLVDNLLIVLEQGGRLAAVRGTRSDGVVTLEQAAYTPCRVATETGCPKEPVWKITAVRVTYDPNRQRISYSGARVHLFGLPPLPLPALSHPTGGSAGPGLLVPDFRYSRANGFELAVPYYIRFAPNRDLVITPHVFTGVLPMIEGSYRQLSDKGAFAVTGYGTYSRQSDATSGTELPDESEGAFRGSIEAVGRFQFDPQWSVSGSLRAVTDPTFLRRYDISRDDRLRSTISLDRYGQKSYFQLAGWAVQTLRTGDVQGQQPIAFPALDYRRRFADPLLGGTIEAQVNSLGILRTEGQDTQRAFAGATWTVRRLTSLGQEVSLTGYARGDVYHTGDTMLTDRVEYRGKPGVHARAIGAAAIDVKWPLIGSFLGGTQRLTPRVQLVAAPRLSNFDVPNEDARAVELEDSNLFALNRFPGYDRFEDGTRVTYGLDWSLSLPRFSIDTTVGQSYRLQRRPELFADGTGLPDRLSDIVGRTELRFRDFVSFIHRYRLDKDTLAVRRNEIDATVGSRVTYATIGYLRLNRDIGDTLEDLQDREEARIGGRVQIANYWSVFGSATVDLTNRDEDPLSVVDGFDPVRHRFGVAYEDDCIALGLTWRRDYEDTGDARRGNSFLLRLALKNLGR